MNTKNLLDSEIIYPLSAWINKRHPLPERFYNKEFKDKPNNEWSVWVTLEEKGPIYKAHGMNWQSLEESIYKTQYYLSEADLLINGLEGGWLDSEEQTIILNELGKPPMPCLPLYLITCGDGKDEKIAYIGETKNTKRFNGGHLSALKLHHPKYDNKSKNIYRCSIWFHFNDEYIVLDWIQPKELALKILRSIESQFIFHFQPELNINKKNKNHTTWDFYIHIQNFLENGFLKDTFV